MKGLIGVLGGMGPAATVDLFNKFVSYTVANRDQEHIPLIISSIPDIPDRTEALLNHGESPLPLMTDYLKKLESAGAECIVIPCNTAHFWFSELKKACHVDMLSIVETTMKEVLATKKKNIGLLATNATMYMGLYQKNIENKHLNCITPDKKSQENVMESIYLLKSGNKKIAESIMKQQAEILFSRGAEIIVLGCTEVPVILENEINSYPDKYIDSTSSLVRASIHWYENRVGKQNLMINKNI
ncbi:MULTISPECIES: aspartate/glutamate racemase family protein [Providencia]|uniref:Amino acid racemase n=1 Tax=Providencia huaxiensis TaxID=2027290 RepID=A0A8I2IPW2_9GAMM|nr:MULTISPECIES: amino acid racemase [Providencia]MBN6363650.1 amino acid racemase [Providencia huaxiensis]MBQ0270195.1 amino acid racemase [Providencia huaxiensis]MBQ0534599.1 amino acid racemase [Providencia huaxiensis]MBQ0589230.1 amino acid racemase [Providencia huaxiensis]MCD2527535.1 amino acid racemase [Providencia huaxiensis]